MATKLLDICQITPPPKSVPPTTLPLTYLDLVWYPLPYPVQRLFLYPFSSPTSTFNSTHLPNLKLSLSLTLKHFYPLASKLLIPPDIGFPCISYSEGDYITLTVAESDDDPLALSSDQTRVASKFRSLVPSLPNLAIAAIQVTLFPGKGIAVGLSTLHGAMDGSSSMHFMRSWASISKREDYSQTLVLENPPFFDRSVVLDPNGLREAFFSRIKSRAKPSNGITRKPMDQEMVRVTLRLSRTKLEKLREWVSAKKISMGSRCSSFALTTGLVWSCMLKAGVFKENLSCWLAFLVDCRARFDPPLPSTYFGNCLSGCAVEVDERLLVEKDGFAVAAEAVMKNIRGLEGGSAVARLAEEMDLAAKVGREMPLTIAGSPRHGVYDVDFGWGRPSKVEVVSIDRGKAISLAENGAGDGGLEVGLALPTTTIDKVVKLFHESLEMCGC